MNKRLSKLSDLKNIGPKTEKWLNEFEIYTLEDLENYSPVTLYQILRSNGYDVNMIFVYALQGAIMDLHWNELPKDIRDQLKQELDEHKK
jgi:DNA transformation protein